MEWVPGFGAAKKDRDRGRRSVDETKRAERHHHSCCREDTLVYVQQKNHNENPVKVFQPIFPELQESLDAARNSGISKEPSIHRSRNDHLAPENKPDRSPRAVFFCDEERTKVPKESPQELLWRTGNGSKSQ